LFVIGEGGEGAESASPDSRREQLGPYVLELLGDNKLKGGAPLHPASEAKTVRKRKGSVTAVDGPYVETKEVIGGYFVVEADSLDEAVDLARRCPGAAYGAVEVRQILPMG
ncbi:MAG TPA: YciI family protein, partial [Acidimicrobiia bacterium]|nr:YciI family protein [Acidimicrobiia bacterium]